MKKYLFMLLLVPTLFFATDEVHAVEYDYTNGWFDKNPDKFTTSSPQIVDNNLSTQVKVNNEYKEITFNEEQKLQILSLYNYADSSGSSAVLNIHLFNGEGVLVHSERVNLSGSPVDKFITLNLEEPLSVKTIKFKSSGSTYVGALWLSEFEIFTADNVEGVSNVSIEPTYNSLTVDFEKPDEAIAVDLFLNSVLVATLTDETTYTIKNLTANTNYEVSLVARYDGGVASGSVTRNVTTSDTPNIDDFVSVSNITSNSAVFTFDKNKLKTYKSINIYDVQGRLYKEVPNYNNSITLTSLESLTEYTFFVEVVLDDKNVTSSKQQVTFTTKEASAEITNLTAKAKYNRVDLSWELPERSDFEYVTIYRKENQKALFSLFSAGEEYDPLFETNGTYFNDLTVEPETSYTYLLTSFLTSGEETKGVSVDVETPPVAMVGDDIEQDENEDYVITWTDPTTGKILVSVGGEEYAIVNASDLKIIIPKEDMKLNGVGLPDVVLTPLDENGVPIGKPSKPDGSDMGSIIGGIDLSEGFKANNLLLIAVGLLGLVVMFVLLGLGFRVVPKLINTITVAIKGGKSV